jgi:hypothetical protein
VYAWAPSAQKHFSFDIKCNCATQQLGLNNKHFPKMVVLAFAFWKTRNVLCFFLLHLYLASVKNCFWHAAYHHLWKHDISRYIACRMWEVILLPPSNLVTRWLWRAAEFAAPKYVTLAKRSFWTQIHWEDIFLKAKRVCKGFPSPFPTGHRKDRS